MTRGKAELEPYEPPEEPEGASQNGDGDRVGPITVGSLPTRRRNRHNNLLPEEKSALIHDLAAELETRAALARKYGVGSPSITKFAERHAAEIAIARRVIATPMSRLWAAQKELRIEALQEDYEQSRQSEYHDHFKQITARTDIMNAISEQLGQTPPRQQVVVVPATYVLVVEGVSQDEIDRMIT